MKNLINKFQNFFNPKHPLHLGFWNKNCSIVQMKKWCGDHGIDWKKEIRKKIKNNKYESVLDCGAGVFSEYFGFKNDEYDITYEATEITDKFIQYGRDNGITVKHFTIDCMDFSDNSFDCVLCYDVLNHQTDYKKELEELIRVAKKEIIISFFKPFLCDKDFEKALGKQYPSRVSKLGIIQDRMSNVFKQTNLIYHYFDKQIMEEFLNSLDISYNFQTVYGKQILFIKK
tara:strand:+ start:1705 stop:2391 length:687 start_codon:yes stop_codon:yes gene_type:complete